MKRINSVIISSLLAAALVGGTSVAAAGIAKDGVFSSDASQILSSVVNFAGSGDAGNKDADVKTSLFRSPQSILVLTDGSIIVSDTNNQLLRKIAGGNVTTFAGASVSKDKQGFPVGGLLDGVVDQSFFNHPNGIAASSDGSIYVADADNNAIRKIDKTGAVTTIAGKGVQGKIDGPGKDARLNHPTDIAVAKDGTIYIADTLNHSIRKITTDGMVSTLNAASDRTVELTATTKVTVGDYKDGALAQAKFNEPSGLALDAKGNLYVSDTGNQRIRYIDLKLGIVSTVAGSATSTATQTLYEKNASYAVGDYADGNADHALFNHPLGITVTSEGGLLIADSLNNSVRYLYQGNVSTMAGEVDQFAGEVNGIERTASFSIPTDVAVAADGSILVADSFNNKIRTISTYHLPAAIGTDDTIKVVLNSDLVKLDSDAEISESRTMIPVRAVAEALGYKVSNSETTNGQVIDIKNDTITIRMIIGKKQVTRIETGKPDVVTDIDVAPYINKGNRTLVPVRFFAEQIGLDVQWNQAHHAATIRNKTGN